MDKMIIIDIETQDFRVEAGIYEVACIVVENYHIVDKLYLGERIDNYSGPLDYGRGFHNICYDHEIIEEFQRFLRKYNYPLVAHNCPFEKKFLLHYQWIDSNYPLYCSMRAIRYNNLGLKSYSMSNLVNYFNVGLENSHTAMGDAYALYEVLEKVRPKTWLKIGEKK